MVVSFFALSPLLRQIMNRLFLPEAPVWFIMMLLALLANRELATWPAGAGSL
jgi:hypothetical protein